jgi:hypothetical protein
MARDPATLYERLKPSMAERGDIGLTPSEASRLLAICVDLIDLCAKVTGRIDPAVGSVVSYARDEALSIALKN